MSFEREFACYEPLRRIFDNEKINELLDRMRLREKTKSNKILLDFLIYKKDLQQSLIQPHLIISIDGSHSEKEIDNGFPGAEIGYITISSVLIDMNKVNECAKDEFIDPKKFRETEKASTIETVFPGCNIILDTEKSSKSSLRRAIFEELKNNSVFSEGETLLDTYEYLLKLKQENFPNTSNKPKSPIEGVDKDMIYGYGEYVCPDSGEALFSTDALRLHELMNPAGSNGEMFGQIMATFEKLWFIHILRSFESKGWLPTLRNTAFILDGPLAVFSVSSWLTKVIEIELKRINDEQKKTNGTDMLIIGIEKSGVFFNHFMNIDTDKESPTDEFPKQAALLLDDQYIKENIIFSDSTKPYGQDTYFGRKFFYKTKSGQRLVVVSASFSSYQKDIKKAMPTQFSRLGDIMELLDKESSSRYPNSITSLISAHAEAAIPVNKGKAAFENIAREIREKENI